MQNPDLRSTFLFQKAILESPISSDEKVRILLEAITGWLNDSSESVFAPPKKTHSTVRDLPTYSPKDVEKHELNDKEVGSLFYMVKQLTGNDLTQSDTNMYLGFYEDLGLSIDVIGVLLHYCVSRGKRARNYIKTVAFSWADMGIDTVEAAELYISLFNNEYRQIHRALGISGRDPIDAEINYMNRWLMEMDMPIDVIKLACEKTIMQIANANFKYVDKILESWHSEKITSVEEIKALEESYYDELKEQHKKGHFNGKLKKGKVTKFQNFKGHEWNYEELEAKERELQNRKLGMVSK